MVRMPLASFDEAARQWSASLGGSIEEQQLRTKTIIRLRSEIEYIDRFKSKGNTTLKLCHPEAKLKKVFLNDREI